MQKSEARILVYHTTPRFAVWTLPTHPNRLELIPGTATKANTVDWLTGDTFNLEAPILNFTIQELLDDGFRAQVVEVLNFWIEYDVENLARIRNGIPSFWVPHDYETNTTRYSGWTQQYGPIRKDSLQLAQNRLKELLGCLTRHHYRDEDMVNAAIYAMVLRQLSPGGYSAPCGPSDPGDPHNYEVHNKLNKLFGMEPPSYMFQACDSLLKILKDELARHGMANSSSLSS